MGRRCLRLGMDGYARMLAVLRRPITRDAFIAAADVGRTAARRFLVACHAARRVRIVGWATPFRQAPVPIWKFGRGPDAPPPAERPNGRPVAGPPQCCRGEGAEIPEELAKFFALLDAMEQPITVLHLIRATGIAERTVRKTVEALHDTEQCHIARWDRREADDTGPWIPVYVLGAGQDAPKPADTPKRITNRRYFLRQKYGAPDAKVEIIEHKPGRYEVAHVPAFFSAMAIGNYLPANTAISRAYGRP